MKILKVHISYTSKLNLEGGGRFVFFLNLMWIKVFQKCPIQI